MHDMQFKISLFYYSRISKFFHKQNRHETETVSDIGLKLRLRLSLRLDAKRIIFTPSH